ncbi:MAG: SPOR domain-containing protein [Tannerellaceae bacterium]
MLRIISHLETLLLDHNCVIVPKLGGFVLQEQGFDYIGQTHTFSTTSKSISFNKSLQHNDGLLTESYMKMYAISFEEAKSMIEADIKEINHAIVENGSVDLSTLGVLKLENGITNFYPSEDEYSFSADTYGLENICLPTLNELLNIPEEAPEQDTIYIPIKRKAFKWVAAAAAIIAIAVTISIPTLDSLGLKTNYASIIPKQTIKALNDIHTHNSYTGINEDISTLIDKIAEPEDIYNTTSNDSTSIDFAATEEISSLDNTTLLLEEISIEEDINQKQAKVITSPAKDAKSLVVKDTTKVVATTPPNEKKGVMINMTPSKTKEYYIVVGSFPNKTQALQLYDKFSAAKIQTLGIIERDGKYRIYANKFENRENADKYLLDLKKNPDFKDAWVFATK